GDAALDRRARHARALKDRRNHLTCAGDRELDDDAATETGVPEELLLVAVLHLAPQTRRAWPPRGKEKAGPRSLPTFAGAGVGPSGVTSPPMPGVRLPRSPALVAPPSRWSSPRISRGSAGASPPAAEPIR